MHTIIRNLSAGTVLTALLTTSAPAETAQTSNNVFEPANIAAGLLRFAVTYGRMIADIRYDTLEVDPVRGGLVLRGLKISGIGPYSDCDISVGRLRLSGTSFWLQEDMRSRLDASGISVANNCFGPEAAMISLVTGGDSIAVSDLTIDVYQSTGQGSLTMDAEINSPGIARLEAAADFDYFSTVFPGIFKELAGSRTSIPQDYSENGAMDRPDITMGVRGTLRSAHISVENLGVWERIQPLLPPQMSDPARADNLIPPGSFPELREIERDLADALKGFIIEPNRITVEIRPEQPIDFDITGWMGPLETARLFMPVFSNTLPTPPVTLIADPADAGEDPRTLGLALAHGRGVPQNIPRAINLLTPLQDDGEVALALAELKAGDQPVEAYVHALTAARAGISSAPGLLDRLEGRLPTAGLLAAQPAADTELADAVFDSVPALRDAALAYEEGDGVPRSYAIAWRLASLAAAAGDGQAQSLMTRLDSRFNDDPEWVEIRNEAADLALEDWAARDLASHLTAK